MQNDGTHRASVNQRSTNASNTEEPAGRLSAVGKRLPGPAPLAINPLSRLARDRVRAELQNNQSWMFNYSIIKLEAPDLAKVLNEWMPALEATVSPLRISAIEMTFAAPLTTDVPTSDGAEAFAAFARTCSKLIDRVAPGEPTTISLFWSASMPHISDCLNDWRLDLDPIRADVQQAGEQLIREIEVWLRGMDRFILNLEHQGVYDK